MRSIFLSDLPSTYSLRSLVPFILILVPSRTEGLVGQHQKSSRAWHVSAPYLRLRHLQNPASPVHRRTRPRPPRPLLRGPFATLLCQPKPHNLTSRINRSELADPLHPGPGPAKAALSLCAPRGGLGFRRPCSVTATTTNRVPTLSLSAPPLCACCTPGGAEFQVPARPNGAPTSPR